VQGAGTTSAIIMWPTVWPPVFFSHALVHTMPATSFSSKMITNKACSILSTRVGDITVGSAYFWMIIIGLLANLFTVMITYAIQKAGGGDLSAYIKLPTM
jgi:hypothetical protein